MASNLPSSFGKSAPPQYVPPAPGFKPSQPETKAAPGQHSNIALFASIIALVLSIASFYGTFFAGDKELSSGQKAQLLGIAHDLNALQDRNIVLSAPVSTTIYLNRSYPIKDLFPAQFDLPLGFGIPIDTEIVGVTSAGMPVIIRIQNETVPVNLSIPISSADAFGNNTILIQKELPVEAKFTSSIKVRAAYGQDLNNIIDKLESIAGESSQQ